MVWKWISPLQRPEAVIEMRTSSPVRGGRVVVDWTMAPEGEPLKTVIVMVAGEDMSCSAVERLEG